MALPAWVVYWLFDGSCADPRTDGYVGVTNRLWRELNRKRNGWRSIPLNCPYKILLQGTKAQCLKLEALLRPTPHIGWNIGRGGFLNGGGLKGIPKSEAQKAKMREAALRRYADPAEHERTSLAVKKGLKGLDRSGPANSNFGKPTSEAAKQKMRDRIAERGGVTGSNNPNFKHGRYSQ